MHRELPKAESLKQASNIEDTELKTYYQSATEVCTEKHFPEVFVQIERRRNEVCAKKPNIRTKYCSEYLNKDI